MKRLIKVLAGLMLISGSAYAYTYPGMTVRNSDGNELKVNSDGTIGVSFTGTTTFDGTVTNNYGIIGATLAINGWSTFGNTLTETYGISASTGLFSQWVNVGGDLTVADDIWAKGVSASSSNFTGNMNVTTFIKTAGLLVGNTSTFNATITANQGIITAGVNASSVTLSGVLNANQGVITTGINASSATFADTLTETYGVTAATITATNKLTVSGANGISNTYGISSATGTFTTNIRTPKIGLSSAYEVGVDTPTYVGELMRTSAFVLYIATGTSNCMDWTKVGGQ